MPFDEEELDPHGECRAEIERLRKELGRAYRCIRGFWTVTKKGDLVADKTMLAYHNPTIAAACRFVADGALDGAEYFIGKHVSVMHEALDK
jgi:hypothetical protein